MLLQTHNSDKVSAFYQEHYFYHIILDKVLDQDYWILGEKPNMQ